MKKKKVLEWPVAGRHKVVKISRAYYLVLPIEWLKAHKINPKKGQEFTVIGDKHLLIVNPKFENEIVKQVMGIVKRAIPKAQKRKSAAKRRKCAIGKRKARP